MVRSVACRVGALLLGACSSCSPAGGTAPSGAFGDAGPVSHAPRDAAGGDAPREDAPATSLGGLEQAYVDLGFGMFVHFNMSTFARADATGVVGEWEQGGEDPKLFAPTALDAAQWADAAVAAHMRYAVLTTKHHGGFSLWDTAQSTHDVASSPFRGGHGDVVKEFVDAFRSRGLKVGLYFSIWDRTNGEDLGFIEGQLTELLTRYGEISCLWFDGWGWNVGYDAVPFDEIYRHVKSLQPNVLVVENNHKRDLTHTDIVVYERMVDGIPPANNAIPSEVAMTVRADGAWFYHPAGGDELRSVDFIVHQSLDPVRAAHGTVLLDVTPDQRGLIPENQVALLQGVGAGLAAGR
ncbi:MAG TPA: alpha-L-fucosidase [Polyangiaceae bacterium]|nr:alpha-L-fucosidase [Polyangiaceae bacterium]